MFEVMEVGGRPVKMWLPEGHQIEEDARQQLGRVSRLPFVTHVSCMPDVHVGMGATIGSVIGTDRAIIPAAVGVDIGCGMIAQPLGVSADKLPDNLREVRDAIEKAVPHGRTDNGQANDRGAWGDVPNGVAKLWRNELSERNEVILKKHPKIKHGYTVNQLGTLGTGNHFIELCLDEEGMLWVMLHSGSRGPGNKIGSYFINLAKEDMRIHHIGVEDRDLSYLSEGTQWFDDYVEAVGWAQDYARINRDIMMRNVTGSLWRLAQDGKFPEFRLRFNFLKSDGIVDSEKMQGVVNCHHNYVTREQHRVKGGMKNIWVTRKGALQAREGTLGIIPSNMANGSFIVRGKGNTDSLNSCSHGAGRIMSRTEAKRRFTVEDVIKQTEGVECRKDEGVIDEIPGAYKNLDAVMEAQADLVEVVHTLKQVVNVKG